MTGQPYVPFPETRPNPFVGTLPSNLAPSTPLAGHGPPEGSVPGIPGHRYTDIDTGNIYLKIQGTQLLGWQLVGAAGQAGVAVIG